jgi:hypothetical protein
MVKQINWINTCNRFVAFIDIMGFKDTVYRRDHESVLKLMHSLFAVVSPIKKDAEKKLKGYEEGKSYDSIVEPIMFSDSILLVSNNDSPESARFIIFNTRWIIEKALTNGIPIKGAIAHGEETADFDLSLHFGRPLIDAYELQNEVMLYGVILHHTMEKTLVESNLMKTYSDVILKYQIPMKSNIITHYIVKPTYLEKENESIINKLYGNVSGAARCYVDNTAKFLEFVNQLSINK